MSDQIEATEFEMNGEKFRVPKDGSWIPRDRLNEAVQKERDKNLQLEGQLKALQQSKDTSSSAKDEKFYTLAELRRAVEDEKISQEQMDSIYDNQVQRMIEKRVNDSLVEYDTKTTKLSTVNAQLNAYLEVLPDVLTDGSEHRSKVATEYNRLMSIFGSPEPESLEDKKLQIAALNAAFGPVENLRKKKITEAETDLETHQESGSSSGDEDSNQSSIIKKLDKRKKEYYRGMIAKGYYKDWKDVEEELKFAGKRG